MYCKKCGKQIPDDSIYCPICGSSQKESGDERVKFTKPVSKHLYYGKIGRNNSAPVGMMFIPIAFGIIFIIIGITIMPGSIINYFSIVFAVFFIITYVNMMRKASNLNKTFKSKEVKSIQGDEIYALVTNRQEIEAHNQTRYSIIYEYMYNDEHCQVVQEIFKESNFRKLNGYDEELYHEKHSRNILLCPFLHYCLKVIFSLYSKSFKIRLTFALMISSVKGSLDVNINLTAIDFSSSFIFSPSYKSNI